MPQLTKISLCLTPAEAESIEFSRRRLAKVDVLLNQSEAVRAAIALMTQVDDAALVRAAKSTTHLKPGRKPSRAKP